MLRPLGGGRNIDRLQGDRLYALAANPLRGGLSRVDMAMAASCPVTRGLRRCPVGIV